MVAVEVASPNRAEECRVEVVVGATVELHLVHCFSAVEGQLADYPVPSSPARFSSYTLPGSPTHWVGAVPELLVEESSVVVAGGVLEGVGHEVEEEAGMEPSISATNGENSHSSSFVQSFCGEGNRRAHKKVKLVLS